MTHRPSNARRNLIPYLALLLVLVLGVGGGYALAASKTKTITVCADKKTGILHLKARGKCKRSQTRVTWNQRGPQGSRGAQGPTGQPGAPGINVWANVSQAGVVIAGRGLSVQHVPASGTYQVTITAPECAQGSNAPVVTVAGPSSSGGQFPVAWYGTTGLNQTFQVFTGEVVSGSFKPSDQSFTVMDTCM